jgi:hypothetical protein
MLRGHTTSPKRCRPRGGGRRLPFPRVLPRSIPVSDSTLPACSNSATQIAAAADDCETVSPPTRWRTVQVKGAPSDCCNGSGTAAHPEHVALDEWDGHTPRPHREVVVDGRQGTVRHLAVDQKQVRKEPVQRQRWLLGVAADPSSDGFRACLRRLCRRS